MVLRASFTLAGRDGGRFQPQERPHGQRRQGRDGGEPGMLRDVAAIGHDGEILGMEEKPAADGDQHQRDQLQDGADILHQAEDPQPAQIDEGQQPQQADGDRGACHRMGQLGEEHGEIADHRYRDRRIADPGRLPIAPGAQETGKIAIGRPGIDMRAAGRGNDGGELGEHEGQRQRRADGDGPTPQRQGAVGCEDRGQHENAGADHVAHHQRDATPQTHGLLLHGAPPFQPASGCRRRYSALISAQTSCRCGPSRMMTKSSTAQTSP